MHNKLLNISAIRYHFKLNDKETEAFIAGFLADLATSRQQIKHCYQQLTRSLTEMSRQTALVALERTVHQLKGRTCQGHVPQLDQRCTQFGLALHQQVADAQPDLSVLAPLYQQLMTHIAAIFAVHASTRRVEGDADVADAETVSEADKPLPLLIVEDNPIASRVASNLFMQVQPHCEITVVDQAYQAIALGEKHRYAGILLDLGLPDQDGSVVAKTLRQSLASKNQSTLR